MKTVGRMPAGRVTRRKISSKLSKRYFARMQESRFRPLCLSLPFPALLNPEERGSEIHPILTPPLFESNSVLDLSFSLSFYRISCSRELKIFLRVCFQFIRNEFEWKNHIDGFFVILFLAIIGNGRQKCNYIAAIIIVYT